MSQVVLAGDVGGTKTLLALASLEGGRWKIQEERRYENRDFSDFHALLDAFLAANGNAPAAACFAIAAPVTGRSVRLTNLDWIIDADAIAHDFKIPLVRLINDFEAVAVGVEALGEGDMEALQAGRPVVRAPRVVVGAGTGLGVAWLVHSGERYTPIPTEAGHTDFAPQGELQIGLLRYLAEKFGHVSWERVLSGHGLIEVFRYLDEERSGKPLGLGPLGPDEDAAARITDLALHHSHPVADQALDLFARIYGAVAGNLALAGLTRGGVYIAGGIAPKILPRLKDGRFIEAFRDKGRFASLLAEMPVMVVTNPKIGLLGAMLAAVA
jgi:glucokinase